MDLKEKEFIKYKLGLCIQRLIDENTGASNKDSKSGISSLRGLAAAAAIEYSIIQKITSGKKNPEFTTLVSIADGFRIKLSELILKYESIKELEVLDYMSLLNIKKQERSGMKKRT